jgi:hypothetical protein
MCDKAKGVDTWNRFLQSKQTIFHLEVLAIMLSSVQQRLSRIISGFINAFCSLTTAAESIPIQLRRIVTNPVGNGGHSMGRNHANLAARSATYLAQDIESAGRSDGLIGAEALLKSLNLEMVRVLDAVITLCEEVTP